MEIAEEKIAWVKRYLLEYEIYWKSYLGYVKTFHYEVEEKATQGVRVKPENVKRALDYAFYHGIRHIFGREFADKKITPLELQTIFKLLKDGNNVR